MRIISSILLFILVFVMFSNDILAMESRSLEELQIRCTLGDCMYLGIEEVELIDIFADGSIQEITDFNLEVSNDLVEIKGDKTLSPKSEGVFTIKATYKGKIAEQTMEIIDMEGAIDELKNIIEDMATDKIDVDITWEWLENDIKVSWTEIPDIKSYIVSRKSDEGEYIKIIENL